MDATFHARRRCRERHGFALNRNVIATLRAGIKNGKATFVGESHLGQNREVWAMDYGGSRLCFVIDKMTSCIITVCTPGNPL